ncbi:Nop6p SCDLUD_002974 [Saccharomycodes ludwigii]|uniref:Nop6p n=1 Tax=Saccharomycodes ludwigii TaxID=36035 RepID=UPI001E82A716|nr:hypothetical protein SCDLUD_002974 [Saccharomycodes ludwigii]KAH3901479.1 hypothetical protein SCDLUD_002974 [Saccharomycodes ludwigii]
MTDIGNSTATGTQKLTKKQLKAKQFKKTKEEREKEKDLRKRKKEEEEEGNDKQESAAPLKKKRKTRRGKGGKTKNKNSGNRFIIFVGNLPYDVDKTDLIAHFKSSSPDEIRIRSDKGIAFLEFDGAKDSVNIQRRMDKALLQHKTLLKNRRINVELTAGGGGNSSNRLEKIKKKNDVLDKERDERLTKLKSGSATTNNNKTNNNTISVSSTHTHPDRLKLLK